MVVAPNLPQVIPAKPRRQSLPIRLIPKDEPAQKSWWRDRLALFATAIGITVLIHVVTVAALTWLGVLQGCGCLW